MKRETVDFLVVDDDQEFRSRLVRALVRRSYRVAEAESVAQSDAVIEQYAPERVIVDLRMPGGSGLELIKSLLSADPETKIVMLTGHGSIATAVEAMQLGAVNYLTKPADTEQILAAFEVPADGREQDSPSVPSLDEVEWEHIQRVMRECSDNVTHAARLLGMHRRSLQRKLARGK